MPSAVEVMVAEDGNGVLIYEGKGEIDEIRGEQVKEGFAFGGGDEVKETCYVEEVGEGADGDGDGGRGRGGGGGAGVILGAAAEGYGFQGSGWGGEGGARCERCVLVGEVNGNWDENTVAYHHRLWVRCSLLD